MDSRTPLLSPEPAGCDGGPTAPGQNATTVRLLAGEDPPAVRIVLQAILWGRIIAEAEAFTGFGAPIDPLFGMDYEHGPGVAERAALIGACGKALARVLDLDACSVTLPMGASELRQRLQAYVQAAYENLEELGPDELPWAVELLRAAKQGVDGGAS